MTGLELYIGTVIDEKYRLDSLLGKGGMGAVFLATHLGTERPVALKIIAPQFMQNSEFVERFKREARAAGRLRHPNVVDVTDFGFARTGSQRLAYLVMEYLDGCTLADVLAEESRLPLEWVLDIIEQVSSAVEEAHQQGILHRDLKPDNIWLEPNRLGGYRVKVLDFGIAKLADPAPMALPASAAETLITTGDAAVRPAPQLPEAETAEAVTQYYIPVTGAVEEAGTQLFEPSPAGSDPQIAEAETQILPAAPEDNGDRTQMLDHQTDRDSRSGSTRPLAGSTTSAVTRVGAILGTPLYMSPEQCRGEHLDARSDIYSLGIITYQMLSGETPFAGDMLSVMRMHNEAVPVDLRIRNRKVPKRVAQHVMSSLAKQPDQRPSGAAAFADALRANAEGADTLFRRAFALYSEHFPAFFRVSLLAFAPYIVLTFAAVAFVVLNWSNVDSFSVKAVSTVFGLLLFVANYLAAAVISGVTVVIVLQLSVAPLRPIQLRSAFAVLRKRWWPFFRTSVRVFLKAMVGFVFLLIPGFIVLYRNFLYGPVVLIEGLTKRPALKRARALMLRSRRTVLMVLLFQIAVPFLLSMVVGAVIAITASGWKRGAPQSDPKQVNVTFSVGRVSSIVTDRIVPLSNILLMPLFSIMTALLYLKVRRIGGETIKEAVELLEDNDVPRSKWQVRMRERLNVTTRGSRG